MTSSSSRSDAGHPRAGFDRIGGSTIKPIATVRRFNRTGEGASCLAKTSDQAVATTEESRHCRFAAKLTPLRADNRVYYLSKLKHVHWI
ncbi:hypothetical protein GCM10007884_50220 [Methylobacterium brachythecii]|nr:hypothetical protein GCM10007884_50220 [Methylobacterium brachythecii]